jgi:hypothetical protein
MGRLRRNENYRTPTPPQAQKKRRTGPHVPLAPDFDQSSDDSDKPPPRFGMNFTDDDTSGSPEVHACLCAADAHFWPCCLPASTNWCGTTLRMLECFRPNLVGTGTPKRQTLRPEWCPATIQRHMRLFQTGTYFRVSCGGQGNLKTIGWGKYTSMDEVQLGSLTTLDCEREGRPGMPVKDFLHQFLLRGPIQHRDAYVRASGKRVPARAAKPAITLQTVTWRFQYEFIPCNQDEDSPDSSSRDTDEGYSTAINDNPRIMGSPDTPPPRKFAMCFTESDDSVENEVRPGTPRTPPRKSALNFTDSNDDSPSEQHTPPSFASQFVRTTSRIRSESKREKSRREHYAQRNLLDVARTTMRDDLLVHVVATKVHPCTHPHIR